MDLRKQVDKKFSQKIVCNVVGEEIDILNKKSYKMKR